MNDKETLSMWAIYDHPSDYPHDYVARRFEVSGSELIATADILLSKSIGMMRALMESRGFIRVNRSESDDPVIVESWL